MSGQSAAVLAVDFRVEDPSWEEVLPDLETVIYRALESAAEKMAISGAVDVLLTSNAEMQALNAKWRDKDKPTDVLSFPADADDNVMGGQPFLGDIALGSGVVSADADKLKRPLDLHVMHLLVHGFLHLLGYDHMSPEDAREMEGLEAEILMPLGLPDPYGDSA